MRWVSAECGNIGKECFKRDVPERGATRLFALERLAQLLRRVDQRIDLRLQRLQLRVLRFDARIQRLSLRDLRVQAVEVRDVGSRKVWLDFAAPTGLQRFGLPLCVASPAPDTHGCDIAD